MKATITLTDGRSQLYENVVDIAFIEHPKQTMITHHDLELVEYYDTDSIKKIEVLP